MLLARAPIQYAVLPLFGRPSVYQSRSVCFMLWAYARRCRPGLAQTQCVACSQASCHSQNPSPEGLGFGDRGCLVGHGLAGAWRMFATRYSAEVAETYIRHWAHLPNKQQKRFRNGLRNPGPSKSTPTRIAMVDFIEVLPARCLI